jgi:hypothetical protein
MGKMIKIINARTVAIVSKTQKRYCFTFQRGNDSPVFHLHRETKADAEIAVSMYRTQIGSLGKVSEITYRVPPQNTATNTRHGKRK